MANISKINDLLDDDATDMGVTQSEIDRLVKDVERAKAKFDKANADLEKAKEKQKKAREDYERATYPLRLLNAIKGTDFGSSSKTSVSENKTQNPQPAKQADTDTNDGQFHSSPMMSMADIRKTND